MLTGDSLFVGDAARPDLAVAAREGARGSLPLARPPRRVAARTSRCYPGHVAGSLCGGNMSPERSSTIGRERETNSALDFRDVQEFVLVSVVGLDTASADDGARRRAEPRPVGALSRRARRARRCRSSATVLDVRTFADHAAGPRAGLDQRPGLGRLVRDEGRLRARARRVRRPARVVASRGRRGRVEALGGRDPRGRRLRARTADARDAGDRRPGGAEGAARTTGGAGGRRPRGPRARRADTCRARRTSRTDCCARSAPAPCSATAGS